MTLEKAVFLQADRMHDEFHRLCTKRDLGLPSDREPTESELAEHWYGCGAASRFAAQEGLCAQNVTQSP